MQEIKCPNCGEVFQVDESSYDSIVKQVRDKEFSKEIEERANYYAREKDAAVKLAQAETAEDLNKKLASKDTEIAELQAKLKASAESLETEKKLAVSEAISAKDKEISEQKEKIALLNGQIETNSKTAQLKEQSIRDSYEEKLKGKDEQIAYYRDLKAKQSTKMVGETLEQHCEIE